MINEVIISVIMPVYNAENTVEMAIKSFILQKNNKLELIIIDGKSSDKSIDIIKKYSDHIAFFISERDEGYADALNKGIKYAKGKYVMMLAADDQLLPGAINKILSSIKKETDIWCGAIIEKMPNRYVCNYSEPNLNKLFSYCSLRHPATLFRRSLFEQFGGYDISYKCAADREIFLRFLKRGASFMVKNIPVVLFFTNGMSMNNPSNISFLEDYRVSKQYGLSEKDATNNLVNARKSLNKNVYKEGIIKLLAKIGILHFIYKLLGRPEKCLTKKEVDILLKFN
jgi:glycosyltransferase involved in cell wall biosynthesis